MNDIEAASILLSLNSKLTIDFVSVDEYFITLDIVLNAERSKIVFVFESAPSQINQFIRELEAVHRDLAGEATLREAFRDSWFRFVILDPAKGRVGFSTQLGIELGGLGNAMRLELNHLETDQSALPGFIQNLKAFPISSKP